MVNTVKIRQRIERSIARRIVSDMIAAGFQISVNDGGETTLNRSTDIKAIMAALFTTDEDWLLMYRPDDGDDNMTGWVRLIYGNDGWDVVNDYTTNLEPHMKGADDVADKMEELYG